MMEGEGSRRTGTLPHRPPPRFFPDGIFFEKSITQTTCFGASNGSATWVRSKIPRSWRLLKPEETPFDIRDNHSVLSFGEPNPSELFETITELEAIFHGAT